MTMRKIDKEIEKLGFKKIEETELIVCYERENTKYNFIHCVDLLHKAHVDNIIQSYDKADDCLCGLTAKESILFGKKLKKKWGNS